MFSKVSIGLDWTEEGLSMVALAKRFGRFRIVDRLQVAGSPEEARPAVAQFMEKHRIRDARINVCLPRRSLLVRFLDLPAETEPELAKVVGFQIDTLHPFKDSEVYWDCAVVSRDREKKLIKVLIVIAEKSGVDQFHQQLIPLGLRTSSMTLAAACLVPILKTAIPETAIVISGRPDGVELLGFHRGDLCSTRDVPTGSGEDVAGRLERELHAVRAFLPVPDPTTVKMFKWNALPDAFTKLLTEVPFLPAPKMGFETTAGRDFGKFWAALGASYADLKRKAAPQINLLPAEKRWQAERNAPGIIYALAGLAVLLTLVAGIHRQIEGALYARALDRQTRRWETRAGGVRKEIQEEQQLMDSAGVLEGARQLTWQKLQVLEELTKLLPDGTWLQEIDVDKDSVVVIGVSQHAADLVQPLENSPYFSHVEFTSPITRDAENRETLRLRMKLKQPVRQ
ncbi:MAG TPA: PilN domain-containing protein [Terriglobia bacterium]|nr:PilN domain-containing protein [Terriglobia bacterium]